MADRPDESKPGKGLNGPNRYLQAVSGKPAGAGMTFGVAIIVFTLLGVWADSALETRPLFLLVGLAVGGVGGFVHLVETVSPGTLFRSRRGDRVARGPNEEQASDDDNP